MTNTTILGVFRTHAQKEYGKVWEMKSTPILNILTRENIRLIARSSLAHYMYGDGLVVLGCFG